MINNMEIQELFFLSDLLFHQCLKLSGAFSVNRNFSKIENVFFMPSGECYNVGFSVIEQIISILLNSPSEVVQTALLDKVYVETCDLKTAEEMFDTLEQVQVPDNMESEGIMEKVSTTPTTITAITLITETTSSAAYSSTSVTTMINRSNML